MSKRIEDLCIFSSRGSMPYEDGENLNEKIISAAAFFGFRSLPDELKIMIHICSEMEFEHRKEALYGNAADHMIAFTCDVNRIFVMEYISVTSVYSIDAYDAVIVHECIHVFQAYYSMQSPKQYVWLYESVACYLANQKKAYCWGNCASWEDFTSDFYSIDYCYSLAYNFGKEMFKQFGNEVLNVIRDPEAYMEQLICLYKEKQQ